MREILAGSSQAGKGQRGCNSAAGLDLWAFWGNRLVHIISKINALSKAGAYIASSPAKLGDTMLEAMKKINE